MSRRFSSGTKHWALLEITHRASHAARRGNDWFSFGEESKRCHLEEIQNWHHCQGQTLFGVIFMYCLSSPELLSRQGNWGSERSMTVRATGLATATASVECWTRLVSKGRLFPRGEPPGSMWFPWEKRRPRLGIRGWPRDLDMTFIEDFIEEIPVWELSLICYLSFTVKNNLPGGDDLVCQRLD